MGVRVCAQPIPGNRAAGGEGQFVIADIFDGRQHETREVVFVAVGRHVGVLDHEPTPVAAKDQISGAAVVREHESTGGRVEMHTAGLRHATRQVRTAFTILLSR